MSKRLVAAMACCFIWGCGTLTTTAERSAELEIKVSAPHRVRSMVDGVQRYLQTGAGPLVLKAAPGTCLRAGPDGVLKVCAP